MPHSKGTAYNSCSRIPAHNRGTKRKHAFQQYLVTEQHTLSLKYPFLMPWQIKHKIIQNWKRLSHKKKNQGFVAMYSDTGCDIWIVLCSG